MEKLHTVGKENLFEAVNCSPILSSGSLLKEHGTEKLIYSPLSERNLPCQGNRLHNPGTDKASKVRNAIHGPSLHRFVCFLILKDCVKNWGSKQLVDFIMF